MDDVPLNNKSAELLQMARKEFGQSRAWTRAEHKMLAAVTTENVAYCGPSPSDHEGNNPEHALQWSHERDIDAKLIRWLCADRRAHELVDPKGIQVYGAKISGKLNLEFLTVPFPLQLEHCAVADGASLYSLEIPALKLEGSWVGPLKAEAVRTKSGIFLGKGFRADGGVQLHGAQIGTVLDCSGGSFRNPGGVAFAGDEIFVGESLFLQGIRAEGQVALPGAQIGGYLLCGGGQFINPPSKGAKNNSSALFADAISVKGRVVLSSQFEGEVRLLDARIGSTLECNGGTFVNPGGRALSLDRATIAADVFLTDGFRAEGMVGLAGARIDGALRCHNGDFWNADLSLENASATSINDADILGPGRGRLHVNGFVYRRAEPLRAETRLAWLDLQPKEPFSPQPYLQLAKVLSEAGDEDGKIKVLVAMRDREWAVQRQGFMAPLGWLEKYTIGYGYRPLLAFWEVMGLSALGWIIYRRSYLAGGVVPADKDAHAEFKQSGQVPSYYRRFFPLIFSVENSLPLVKLGLEDKWEPDPCPEQQPENVTRRPTLGAPRRWPAWLHWLQSALAYVGLQAPGNPRTPRSPVSRWGTSPKFLRWFLWAQILLGWLLATLFLAGVSGIIKKD